MKPDDFNYTTECLACEGTGSVEGYPECPACNGEKRLNRKNIAPEGHVRLHEEVGSNGFVLTEDIAIKEDGGLLDRYGDRSLRDIIDDLRDSDDTYTLNIFNNLFREKGL